MESDLTDDAIIQIVDDVLFRSGVLLEEHRFAASDAIQIASALAWRADAFVSADLRQCAAATDCVNVCAHF